MDFQAIIVAVILCAALIYLGQMLWRKVKSFSPKDSNCGADCGCDSKSNKVLIQVKRK